MAALMRGALSGNFEYSFISLEAHTYNEREAHDSEEQDKQAEHIAQSSNLRYFI